MKKKGHSDTINPRLRYNESVTDPCRVPWRNIRHYYLRLGNVANAEYIGGMYVDGCGKQASSVVNLSERISIFMCVDFILDDSGSGRDDNLLLLHKYDGEK